MDNIPTSNSATALNDELVEALLFPLDEEDVFPIIEREHVLLVCI